eukprot:scpid97783/ scgid5673/ OTU domain-containing protein 3
MAKKKQSKSKRHKEEGRKREERSAKPALKHERQSKRENYLEEDDVEFISFANQLQAKGLKIKDVPGDGNCLFRALADQLDGDMARHDQHRQETVHNMIDHRQVKNGKKRCSHPQYGRKKKSKPAPARKRKDFAARVLTRLEKDKSVSISEYTASSVGHR